MSALAQLHAAQLFALAVMVGAMAAVTVTVDLFLTKRISPVVTRQIVFLVNVPVGFVVSLTVWSELSTPATSFLVEVLVCAIASFLAAAGAPHYHRLAAAIIRWKFPGLDIETAFQAKPKEQP